MRFVQMYSCWSKSRTNLGKDFVRNCYINKIIKRSAKK